MKLFGLELGQLVRIHFTELLDLAFDHFLLVEHIRLVLELAYVAADLLQLGDGLSGENILAPYGKISHPRVKSWSHESN